MHANLIAGRDKYLEKIKNGEIVRSKKSKSPSFKKSILAKCKECMCDYVDGRLDCGVTSCSLYHWMPYGELRKKRNERSEIAG